MNTATPPAGSPFSDALLNVNIKEISIQKGSVKPFLPNGCEDPTGGAAYKQFYAAVKYSITNSGPDFTPPPGYHGLAECAQKPAVYKFLQLDGLLTSGDTNIPLKYVTCVVDDDAAAGSNACSAALSGMSIRNGRSFGVTKNLTVKFLLTQSQFSELLSTLPDRILNVQLSVNPLIAGGTPASASLKLGNALNSENWLSSDVIPSPVVIYPVPTQAPTGSIILNYSYYGNCI